MKVQLKSNGNTFEIAKAEFEKFSPERKRNYKIIDKEDAKEAPAQTTSNTSEKVDKKKDTDKTGGEPAKS